MEKQRRRLAPWLALAALMVVCTGIGWLLGVRNRDDDLTVERRLRALEQQPRAGAAVRADLDGADGFRSSNRVRRPRAADDAGEPAPLAADIRTQEQWAIARDAAIAGLERRLAADGRDASWSPEAELATEAAALAPALQPFGMPEEGDVRCGRSMCRMVYTFKSAGQAADWADYYPLGLADTLPEINSHPVLLPDGRIELRMYGFRGTASNQVSASARR